MTPDTTAYMIAGFIVILGGIFFYVISILLRYNQTRNYALLINSINENRSREVGESTMEKHEN